MTPLFEGNILSEHDWEDFLVNNIELLGRGLSFEGRQVATDVGIIDILARDRNSFVIVELKVGEADDAAVGQIIRYMGWFSKNKTPRNVRGILVASKFNEGAKCAAAHVKDLILLQAKIMFNFERVE